MVNHHIAYKLIIAIVVVAIFAIPAIAYSHGSANYGLDWYVLGGGMDKSMSASYAVEGTVGQPLTSPPRSTSTSISVHAGFWYNVKDTPTSTSTNTPTSTSTGTTVPTEATPTPDSVFLPWTKK